jgi:ActR/RegA family two-component response regulator
VCNPHGGFSLVPVRLLLVDDDDSVLSGLKLILEAHDFEVTTAPGVVDALRLITTQSFDVLISDLHMPGAGDGLILVGAMRHANPNAITVVLSANPDMAKATAAILREADEIFIKPPKIAPIVETIRQRLAHAAEQHERLPRFPAVESIATVLERERNSITQRWLAKMAEIGSLNKRSISLNEQLAHLPERINEILYRLRYPQPLGVMALFSIASLQHGATRRRQGFPSPVLIEEARALQVALFRAIEKNMDQIDLGQLPSTLMAIADEVNAQLLQSLSGYENEKPVEFPQEAI